jgi:hypothetical protein
VASAPVSRKVPRADPRHRDRCRPPAPPPPSRAGPICRCGPGVGVRADTQSRDALCASSACHAWSTSRPREVRDARPLGDTDGHDLPGDRRISGCCRGRACPPVAALAYPFCTRPPLTPWFEAREEFRTDGDRARPYTRLAPLKQERGSLLMRTARKSTSATCHRLFATNVLKDRPAHGAYPRRASRGACPRAPGCARVGSHSSRRQAARPARPSRRTRSRMPRV